MTLRDAIPRMQGLGSRRWICQCGNDHRAAIADCFSQLDFWVCGVPRHDVPRLICNSMRIHFATHQCSGFAPPSQHWNPLPDQH